MRGRLARGQERLPGVGPDDAVDREAEPLLVRPDRRVGLLPEDTIHSEIDAPCHQLALHGTNCLPLAAVAHRVKVAADTLVGR